MSTEAGGEEKDSDMAPNPQSPGHDAFEEGLQVLQEAHADPNAGADPAGVAKALGLFKQAITEDPNHGGACAQYGLSLLHSSSDVKEILEEAAIVLSHANDLLKAETTSRVLVQMGLGDALFCLGRVAEAADAYDAALDSLPEGSAEVGEQATPEDHYKHRLHIRMFFGSMALCRHVQALYHYSYLPEFLGQLEGGLVTLEKQMGSLGSEADDSTKMSKEATPKGVPEMTLGEFKSSMQQLSVQSFKKTFTKF
jgi:tetratricopeptide (TPR) repeat protein